MKKFLLSLAAVATAASMSATSYTLFDISNAGEWAGNAEGWGQVVSFGDKKVTITSNKGECTNDLIAPDANTFSWRVYKNSSVKLVAEGISMKKVVITYDDYNEGQYVVALTPGEGWTSAMDAASFTNTMTSAGLSELQFKSAAAQTRIKKIVASDTDEVSDPQTPTDQQAYDPSTGTTPDPGTTPEGVIYENKFDSNLDGWVKINDTALGDYNGWKINSNPKCAIANSYYGGSNHAANAKLQKDFDLTDYENVSVEFEQAFGYDFPTAQNDNYRVYVIADGNTEYLTMANFPPAPDQGNWCREWAKNTFDLSEYDGASSLVIGFEYANDGSKSRAWELKNFVLYGSKNTGVDNIAAEENVAPVYYTLQGVRVAAPESGLYIVVKGGKASKVVF